MIPRVKGSDRRHPVGNDKWFTELADPTVTWGLSPDVGSFTRTI